jgi:hypothetical protein
MGTCDGHGQVETNIAGRLIPLGPFWYTPVYRWSEISWNINLFIVLCFSVARKIAKVPFIPGHECVGEVSIKY